MIPRFLFPLLPYRSFFFPFLIASAITVPCWLFFRLYLHRTRLRDLSFRREILLMIFVVYLSGVAVAALLPNHNSRQAAAATGFDLRPSMASLTCHSPMLRKGSTAQAFCVHNARGNVMLFFPLGILVPLVWRRLRFWRVIQIAVALSVSIEILQYLSRSWSNRSTDINDVILNVVGASLGLIVVSLLHLLNRRSSAAG